MSKIIAILGATGAQGGGLAHAILNDPSGGFTARVLTRDVNSDKAKDLARFGAESLPPTPTIPPVWRRPSKTRTGLTA